MLVLKLVVFTEELAPRLYFGAVWGKAVPTKNRNSASVVLIRVLYNMSKVKVCLDTW